MPPVSEKQANPVTGEITEEAGESMVLEAFKAAGDSLASTDTPEDIQRQIVGRVFKAETLDELFGVWEITTSDMLEGKTLDILEADWSIYHPKDGGGDVPMARVLAVNEGKKFTFVTTSPNLTSFIKRAEILDLLPVTVKIAGSKTSRGQTVLHFERP